MVVVIIAVTFLEAGCARSAHGHRPPNFCIGKSARASPATGLLLCSSSVCDGTHRYVVRKKTVARVRKPRPGTVAAARIFALGKLGSQHKDTRGWRFNVSSTGNPGGGVKSGRITHTVQQLRDLFNTPPAGNRLLSIPACACSTQAGHAQASPSTTPSKALDAPR